MNELSVVVEPLGWPMPVSRGVLANLNPIRLVGSSAGSQLWRHCDERPLLQVVIYPRQQGPLCDFKLDAKGRVRIALNTGLSSYSQQAYQFAHEFCHVLANHSRDGQRHDARHANHWLEESFCEAASLFSLRRMAQEWPTHENFRAWVTAAGVPYAPSVHAYAQARIDTAHATLPLDKDFREWFDGEERFMRSHPIAIEKDKKTCDELRKTYTVIASRLLPLLEANPENWETLSYLNLTPHRDDKPLAEHLADWKAICPEHLQAFIGELEQLFLPFTTAIEDPA